MSERQTADRARLSDDDFVRMMSLMAKADSVELKLTVPSTDHRATIAALPIDPVEAQPRQIFFFDTPDLTLDRAGIVVRARRIAGGRGDTVVKLRPIEPDELDPDLRASGDFNIEVDAMPGGFVCSGSMKGKTSAADVRTALEGGLAIRKLFSKRQRAFFAERAPGGLELDALIPLGPTFVLKTTFEPPDWRQRFVAEVWLYPDGSRILELSTKCLPADAFTVAAQARAYLIGAGVNLSGAQETKTRTALEFYRAALA